MDGMENNPEFAKWLEEGLKGIFGSGQKVKSACIISLFEDETAVTGYYNCDVQDMAVLAHKINTDIILDTITNNIHIIREALEGEDEDDV